jgi:hypothetical protein
MSADPSRERPEDDDSPQGNGYANEEPFEYPRFLGEKRAELNDGQYTATFTGSGYVTSDYDEGSFLSEVSFAGRRRLPAGHSRDIRRLAMADLFPQEWRERAVEYEIIVRARRRRTRDARPKPSPS